MNPFLDYAFDAAQRSMLFWDTLRRAGNAAIAQQGAPPAPQEVLIDGRALPPGRRCVLLRIPPFGIAPSAEPDLAPILAIDPVADPATGGVDPLSALAAAQRAGHATYALVTAQGGGLEEIGACLDLLASRHDAPPVLLAEGVGANIALRLADRHGAGVAAVLLAAPRAEGVTWAEFMALYNEPEAVAPGFLDARRAAGPPLRLPARLAVPVCIAGPAAALGGVLAPAGAVVLCAARAAANPGVFLVPGLLAQVARLAPGLHEAVLIDGRPKLADGDLPPGRFTARLRPLAAAIAAPAQPGLPLLPGLLSGLLSDSNPALRPLGLLAPMLVLTRRVTGPLAEGNPLRAMERAAIQAWSAALMPQAARAPDQRLAGIVRLLLLMALSRPDAEAAAEAWLAALTGALPADLRVDPAQLRAIVAAEAALLRQDRERALEALPAMFPDEASRSLARSVVERVLPGETFQGPGVIA